MTYSDYTQGYAAGGYQQWELDQARISDLTFERDLARRDSNRRLEKLTAANATIAALQQSLDEATAKINSNTPDAFINYPVKRRTFTPQPEPIKVGDIVKYKGGIVTYTVERSWFDEDAEAEIFHVRALSHRGGVYRANARQLVKLS